MTLAAATDYKVERIDDLPSRPESELRDYAEFVRSIERERMPDDPPTPVEVYLSRFRTKAPHGRRIDWIVGPALRR